MEHKIHTSKRLEISVSMIPGLGFTLTYENRYKELVVILGCFLIAFEFKNIIKRKRKL